MAQIVKANYNCTQAELYAGIRLLISNYKLKLADFTALKAKYTLAFGDAILTATSTAEALLSEEARDALAETLRVQLIPLNKKCGDNFQILKSYIGEVFRDGETKPNVQAAGGTLYEKAAAQNWENTVQMNVAAKNFMASNSVKLLDGGNNMPAGFEAAYNADALLFFNKYGEYVAATETTTATTDKIAANNAVYKSATELCADGQTIGRNDAAFAKLFTWSELLNIISPPGDTSLTVTVLFDETGLPAVGAEVMAQLAGDPVLLNGVADDAGEVLFKNINAGNWKVLAKLVGRQEAGATKVVTAGVGARLELRMVL